MADLEVRVIPRAKRDEIAGERSGRLLIRLTAPPVDGRSSAELRAAMTAADGRASR